MATSEEMHLAAQLVTEIERIRYNMRANATSYLARVGTVTAAVLRTEMKADMDQFQRRLERIRRKVDTQAIRTKVVSGLAVYGVDPDVLRADYVTMNNICQQVWDATLANNTAITNACNQILAALAAHDTLYDEPLPTVR